MPPRVPYYIIIYIYTYFYISVWMEVCILRVLTVNLLTFCSQSALLPSEMRTLPILVKDGWLSLGRKKLKRPATARFTGLYDG